MSGCDLDVREDARKGTHVAGAVEVAVASLQEIMELMNKGNLYRTTEATNCNEVSSRSHAVLQVNCGCARIAPSPFLPRLYLVPYLTRPFLRVCPLT